MFGFLNRWRDDRLLEHIVRRHEEEAPVTYAAAFGRGTLRMVVRQLRHPVDGTKGMSPTDILSLIAVILQLITQFQGVIEEIVKRIRELRNK